MTQHSNYLTEAWIRHLAPLAFGANLAPSIFDYPAAELSRVLVWPRNDQHSENRQLTVLRCLAISADRKFAAYLDEIYLGNDVEESQRFWRRVCAKLEHIRARFFSHADDDWSLNSPLDCFATWSNTAMWLDSQRGDPIHPRARAQAKAGIGNERLNAQEMMEAEAQAQRQLEQQCALGIRNALNALVPEILALLVERPLLRMGIIERMTTLAEQYADPNAMRFAMQALKTEAIALLDLAVCAPRCTAGTTVLTAIFSGSSLPGALQLLDISKGVHRRTVRHIHPEVGQSHKAHGLGEVPLSGRNFLVILGLVKHLPFGCWPQQPSEWVEFIAAAMSLHEVAIPRPVLGRVLRWCAIGHFADCSMRIALLMDQVQALTVAARHLYNRNLNLGDAYLIALGMAPIVESSDDVLDRVQKLLNSQDVELTAMELAHFTGVPIEAVVAEAFPVHPGIPKGFQRDQGIDVEPLACVHDVVEHGYACGTCLHELTTAIYFAANGVALYAVRDTSGDPIGTVALRLDDDPLRQSAIVSQVTGLFNRVAPSALFKLAHRLAKSFASEPMDTWLSFVDQAAYFRIKAGAG